MEHRLAYNTKEEFAVDLIHNLNNDPSVHGILVQIPLPDHINIDRVIAHIRPDKDVDGLHNQNMGQLLSKGGLVPCTPLGCITLLRGQLGDLAGLHAVVVGRSRLVGKPLAQLLLRENCTVTVTHSQTRDLPRLVRMADILIVAIGIPKFIQADWIKPGATIIDVGINRTRTDEGKIRLVGDVDFDLAKDIAGAITPVPGGVGPMTIACLLLNTLQAAKASLQNPPP
jgi:methylenetetrahydrofolate dehydrogenase (NADP+)/methenyltetrahydrofolate cyclohydrolase